MYRILETFAVKPDAKGRIALPSALRKALGGEVGGGFFIRRSMQETCLEMYTSRMWEEELGKIQRLNPYVREHRDFIRRFMAGVRFVEADAVGRGQVYVAVDDPQLRSRIIEELEQVRAVDVSGEGRLAVVPKARVKEVLGRSPDVADALMMRMYFVLHPPGATKDLARFFG